MLVSFEELPQNARVWIYQADRNLTEEECRFMEQQTEAFINGWDAHGASLQASFGIPYQRFFILAVNQEYHQPSGCSIDKSVALVRAFEQELKVNFFERTQIPFIVDNKVVTYPMKQLKQLVAEGAITPDTIMLDNTVGTKELLEQKWQVPVQQTWAGRYFPKTVQ